MKVASAVDSKKCREKEKDEWGDNTVKTRNKSMQHKIRISGKF